MPSPLPAYVPGPIADLIYAKKLNGLKGFAERAGIPHTSLCWTLREANHEALTAFVRLCDAIEKEPDEVAPLLGTTDGIDLLKRYIYEKYPSAREMTRIGVISHGYIQKISNGESGKKITDVYAKIGTAAGLTLRELCDLLIR